MLTIEIVIRLSLAMVIGGVIGFEREQKNRPAGMRTHMLVCAGAAIVALIQGEVTSSAIKMTLENPDLVSVIRADQTRLTAQVISGVGFLGAGTILVSKQRVFGLTTAASLWASASVGISIGMGYYQIAIFGFIAIILSLSVVKKIINIPKIRNLEIQYIHRVETKEFLNHYFERHNIEIEDVTFEVKVIDGERIYKNTYTIDLPRLLSYADIIEELSMYSNVQNIRLVSVTE